jgi:hypothetical protein
VQCSICHRKIVADFGSSLNDASINPFPVGKSINEEQLWCLLHALAK